MCTLSVNAVIYHASIQLIFLFSIKVRTAITRIQEKRKALSFTVGYLIGLKLFGQGMLIERLVFRAIFYWFSRTAPSPLASYPPRGLRILPGPAVHVPCPAPRPVILPDKEEYPLPGRWSSRMVSSMSLSDPLHLRSDVILLTHL